MSLRVRLVASLACVLAVTLSLGCALASWHAAKSVRTEMRAALAVGRQAVVNGFEEMAASAEPQRGLRHLIATFDGNRHVRATVTDRRGAVVAVSALAAPARPVPAWFRSAVGPAPDPLRMTLPEGLGEGGAITLDADPTNEIGEVWNEARDGLGILAAFFVLAVALIHWMVGRALRPLAALSAAFDRLGSGDYAARMAGQGPPELAALGRGFNRMAERLGRVEAQNRQLHDQLLTLQEEERAELARDLHDDIGPFLFAVAVDTAGIPALLEAGRMADIRERLDAIGDAVGHMQGCIRSVLGRLRPPSVAEIGLQPAIGNLVAFWRSRHPRIVFALDVIGEDDAIAEPVRATVCRIVQESICNAVRHGRPDRIEIGVAREQDDVVVRVADDGSGLGANGGGQGFGLVGMRERVLAHAGSFAIADRPGGRGLAVTARLPCEGFAA